MMRRDEESGSSSSPGSEHVLDEEIDCGEGILSYIRLGRPRSRSDRTSSPTINRSTGQYVWDFLSWGLTSNYVLEQFSKVTANEKDIVPFASMDQGRLFVRVSVQDLAALQLAYQRGLTALQRSHNQVCKLRDENTQLHDTVKSWSIKTTELTTETITLRQEISNLKHAMRIRSISVDEHKDLISLLCRSICMLLDDTSSKTYYHGSALNNLLQLVFSLPSQVHERLAQSCPKFESLLNSGKPDIQSRIQANEAKGNIERVLKLLPTGSDQTQLNMLMKAVDYQQEMTLRKFPVSEEESAVSAVHSAENSKSEPTSSLEELLSQQKDVNPPLPTREYSNTDLNISSSSASRTDSKQGIPLKAHTRASNGSRAVERLNALLVADSEYRQPSRLSTCDIIQSYHSNTATVPEPVYAEVKVHNQSGNGADRRSKSQSSSMGTPLAQSTPFGTLSTVMSPKHQVNPKSKRKRKKKKISRWNFAARLCSSGRSTTMSESESIESAIYLQTSMPKTRVIRHHGRPSKKSKGYKWFFKKTKDK